jgi:hypothetical protein
MRSFSFLSFLLLSLLSLSCGQSFVYDDYTSGVTFTTGPNTTNVDQDVTYNTISPGSFSFGLFYNHDLDDQINFIRIGPFTLTSDANQAAGCDPSNSPIHLNAVLQQCNYTISWSTQFFGVFEIQYDTMTNNGVPATASTIFAQFINATTQVVGDPQFVGLRGQSYQVHGMDGAIYNIVSDKNLQVNSRFTFLTEGECPMFNGVADTNCWSHPGSYMGEMSFQQVIDGKLHAALITSGTAKQGFAAVQMDGKPIAVGENIKFGTFSLTAVTSHKVVVSTEQFTFELTNSDLFINQALSPKVALSKLTSHGLLGQTHQNRMYSTSIRYIEGEVDDYVIASGDIFGDDFVYNLFQRV